MAEHNFQIFDESMTSIDTDAEYLAEGQRLNGVTPGLASPKMHNKLYRQCSVMAYAMASVLAARGFDANDSDPGALVDAIQRAFAFSVNGNVPNGSGAVTAVRPIDAWPVGSLFMTFQNVNPATLLGGGNWVQIKGRYLLAADTGNPVDGFTTVGAMNKNVPLVSHSHGFSTSTAPNHTHDVGGTTGGAGSHTHTITVNSKTLKGKFSAVARPGYRVSASGIADTAYGNSQIAGGDSDTNWRQDITIDASHNHSGSANTISNHTHGFSATTGGSGQHSHSGTTESSGTGASFNVQPLSIYVYMWRRTA